MFIGNLLFTLPIALIGVAQAASVAVDNYSYLVSPNSSYPDSGGTELTDGTDATIAWFPGSSITVADVAPLTGWLLSNPTIQFNFAGPQSIGEVTVWIADSDGSAGVGLPSTVTVRTPDSSFSRTVNVINPPGAGSTVPITIDGFEVTTNSLVVEMARVHSWTMLSEVTFATPEPSSAALTLLGAACLLRRRRYTK
ncbi:MAG: PEP-CTERM sorting domain-containing protein [Verrucomicrobiaceae bacterium]